MQNGQPKSLPDAFGFRDGVSSVHTSRTMMLDELSLLLENVRADAKPNEYVTAIVEENVLGKPTQTTRERTAKRLTELYMLDPSCTLFRLVRHSWPANHDSRPMIAFLAACGRDPLLREATPFVMGQALGSDVNAVRIGEFLDEKYPSRFKATTRHSTAQNLASSWTQAGYLAGKVKKIRVKPLVTPIVTAFALALGFLCGFRGRLLLDTTWTRLLDRSPAEITDLAVEASRQGWLTYKGAGSVVEITFPGLLKPHEEKGRP